MFLQIIAFELIAVNSPYYYGYAVVGSQRVNNTGNFICFAGCLRKNSGILSTPGPEKVFLPRANFFRPLYDNSENDFY